jgi:hypothetical protein
MPTSKSSKPIAKNNYYVVSAIVAAELFHTLKDCRVINLTASNAQAASLRAGNKAVGFRALTKFIDEMAIYTMKMARHINKLAIQTSKIATATARSESALNRFDEVKRKAEGAEFADSLVGAYSRTKVAHTALRGEFDRLVNEMRCSLEDLEQHLRSANVIASIARVEASRVDEGGSGTFFTVAETVDTMANKIKKRVNYSKNLFNDVKR